MRTRLGFVIEFGRPGSIITTTKNLVQLFAPPPAPPPPQNPKNYKKQKIKTEFLAPPVHDGGG